MANRPLHSTPVKKYNGQGHLENTRITNNSASSSSGMMSMGELETSMVEKQRKELQLLIAELKDRDRELNDMVAAHQQQLAAWERDRQRALMLEKKTERCEGELRKRTEQIRLLIQRLKVSESRHKSKDAALESAKARVIQFEKDMSLTSYQVRDLKDSNASLNSSLTDLSSKMGKMENKDLELTSLLRIRENELCESHDHVAELSAKLRTLDAELQDCRRSESRSRAEMQDERSRCKQTREEIDKLKAETLEKTNQAISYRHDISDLRDEVQRLRKQTYARDDEIRRKDDLIDLQKSKQDRADKELKALRLLYERQQQELSALCARLSDSQELLEKQEEQLNSIGDLNPQERIASKKVVGAELAAAESDNSPGTSGGIKDNLTDINCGVKLKSIGSSQALQERAFQIGKHRSVKLGPVFVKEAAATEQFLQDVSYADSDTGVYSNKSKWLRNETCNSETSVFKGRVNIGRRSRNGLDLSDSEDCGSEATNDLLEEAWRSAASSAIILSDAEEVESPRKSFSYSSPTSKLQKLLAESREMVHNLERAAFTPVPGRSSTQPANGHTQC